MNLTPPTSSTSFILSPPKMDSDHRPWSDLPADILDVIGNLLVFADHLRFAAVCRSWRSASRTTTHFISLSFPYLVLPQNSPSPSTLGLFSPVDGGRTHRLRLPLPGDSRCFGSSFGWLLISLGNTLGCCLLNPFTNNLIPLPNPPSADFKKGTLSSDPTAAGVRSAVIVVAYSYANGLSYCRLGDDRWSVLDYSFWGDFVFFNGMLYCGRNVIRVYEFDPRPKLRRSFRIGNPEVYEKSCYLVECGGEIMMATRDWRIVRGEDGRFRPKTVGFGVFRLELSSVTSKWVAVTSLGDSALFLGDNGESCARTVVPCAGFDGWRGNCVYFTDLNSVVLAGDDSSRECDEGVFCLGDRTVMPLIDLIPNGSHSWSGFPYWFLLNRANA